MKFLKGKLLFLRKSNRSNLLNTNPFSDDSSRLIKLFKKNKEKRIHFGCGPRVLKGWVNIDLFFTPYADYLKYYTDQFYPSNIRGNKSDFVSFDVTKSSLPLKSNSVNLIFHEDFLEHLNQKEQILFLAETFRVLKPGGVHRVNTPDLLSSMKSHSKFDLGFQGVFIEEWDKSLHLNLLTKKTLREMALMVGYKRVVFQRRNKSISSGIPREYRPDPHDRPENGNIFVDLIK